MILPYIIDTMKFKLFSNNTCLIEKKIVLKIPTICVKFIVFIVTSNLVSTFVINTNKLKNKCIVLN